MFSAMAQRGLIVSARLVSWSAASKRPSTKSLRAFSVALRAFPGVRNWLIDTRFCVGDCESTHCDDPVCAGARFAEIASSATNRRAHFELECAARRNADLEYSATLVNSFQHSPS